MRKLFILFAITGLAATTDTWPPAADAKTGEWYGEKVSIKDSAIIADGAAKLIKSDTVNIKIKAKIVEYVLKKVAGLNYGLMNVPLRS